MLVFRVEVLPYAVVSPYSTWESDGSLVVQVTVADVVKISEAATLEITGAVVSTLLTVTVTPDDVVVFPDGSRATAVRVCEPFGTVVEFQDIE